MQKPNFDTLRKNLKGDLETDELHRVLYATDASVYRKLPAAVAYPKDAEDLSTLVSFASKQGLGLIPRAGGTSLAGQCVGTGIVVDVSRYLTKIISLNTNLQQVTVQPGLIRDELNRYLKPFGLFFGPNTSTSNRCMIGGMVGNNSSGTTSIQYGVTRDKVVALKTILADGSEAHFGAISKAEFDEKCKANSLEGNIYSELKKELEIEEVQERIKTNFPKESIHRRNTGYAVDLLLNNQVLGTTDAPFNLCELLTGSEGTLAFTTEITLQLDALPPQYAAMVATHYTSLEASLRDVAPLMEHQLYLCEMMDRIILDCTKDNREQLANRFFVSGDPAAILMLEVRADSEKGLETKLEQLLEAIEISGLSYAHPILRGEEIKKAITLRKAGLGLLGNIVGDRKAVACIEDTAVALEDLKDFIGAFSGIMKKYEQDAVYYAHAGAGELHLRPILNLKKSEDVELFRAITTEVAQLTKKYRGSFSGEHGDGIVRAEFIPMLIGNANYELLRRIKTVFDPKGIFNPGKIVDAYPMDRSLRYEIDREEPEISTLLDFSENQGILRTAEKCNGSGDCRKTEHAAGAMCPSYHATRKEKDTTRGRANALREFLTREDGKNSFDHKELKETFDLCLSCKACARECPSSVDVATLKAEFQYQYQEANGYSLRNRLFANNSQWNALASRVPKLVNTLYTLPVAGNAVKNIMGVAQARSIPKVFNEDFDSFLLKTKQLFAKNKNRVTLYIDEFSRYLDVEVARDAIYCLEALGYDVQLLFAESGRSHISKGFLKQAQKLARKNIAEITPLLKENTPILGLEPSAILTFRDEYKRLAPELSNTKALADQSFLIEEFLAKEIEEGRLESNRFTKAHKTIKIHAHCHQKALSNQKVTFDILNLPTNYSVSIIASGCCGMAGSFGYEKEHYKTSMAIGELKLFPAIRKANQECVIAANGTSCRHQIKDGTSRKALHPITILKEALLIE